MKLGGAWRSANGVVEGVEGAEGIPAIERCKRFARDQEGSIAADAADATKEYGGLLLTYGSSVIVRTNRGSCSLVCRDGLALEAR